MMKVPKKRFVVYLIITCGTKPAFEARFSTLESSCCASRSRKISPVTKGSARFHELRRKEIAEFITRCIRHLKVRYETGFNAAEELKHE
jgi:hypothetical protein